MNEGHALRHSQLGRRVHRLSRLTCRKMFEERFDAARMGREYLHVYRRLVHADSEKSTNR